MVTSYTCDFKVFSRSRTTWPGLMVSEGPKPENIAVASGACVRVYARETSCENLECLVSMAGTWNVLSMCVCFWVRRDLDIPKPQFLKLEIELKSRFIIMKVRPARAGDGGISTAGRGCPSHSSRALPEDSDRDENPTSPRTRVLVGQEPENPKEHRRTAATDPYEWPAT